MEIDGVFHPTTKGVPQGGVVSPLLANVVLNNLDWFLHSKGFHGAARERRACHGQPNVRFSRYADDWCVYLTRCSRKSAERLKDEIRDFLRETCGLELSAEKTRITHVRDGYDFLGFNISVGVGRSGALVPKVKVGRKAIANIQTRLGETLRFAQCRKASRSDLNVLRQSFVAGRNTSRLPTTSRMLPTGWTIRLSGQR